MSAHRSKWGQLTPMEKGWKIKKRKHAKRSSFLCLCYILRAIRAGRCRQRRYADHIFIEIYFRMYHFVVKFSKFTSPQAARGHCPPNQNPADVPGSATTYAGNVALPAFARSTPCCCAPCSNHLIAGPHQQSLLLWAMVGQTDKQTDGRTP